jgi:anhydro-N-acetylmuramic acid kinase
MIYRVIGVSTGHALTGLDIIFVEFSEIGGKWSYEVIATAGSVFTGFWNSQLSEASKKSVLDYQLLHVAFGAYIGEQVNLFIQQYELDHQVHLMASHGYTVFHLPERNMTAQLGHGASIAAVTKLPVVSDLCSLDMAFGGKGELRDAAAHKLLQPESMSLPLTVALLGVLRWREESTLYNSASGASRDSIGGALWLGTEA